MEPKDSLPCPQELVIGLFSLARRIQSRTVFSVSLNYVNGLTKVCMRATYPVHSSSLIWMWSSSLYSFLQHMLANDYES